MKGVVFRDTFFIIDTENSNKVDLILLYMQADLISSYQHRSAIHNLPPALLLRRDRHW